MAVTDTVEIQRILLSERRDPTLRSDTAYRLGLCNNRNAGPLLLAQLQTETDPAVIADLLLALQNLGVTDQLQAAAKQLGHGSSNVRHNAALFYARQQGAQPEPLIAQLRNEAHPAAQHALWQALFELRDATRIELWQPLWTHDDDVLAGLGARAAAGRPGMRQHIKTLLALCRDGSAPVRFGLAAGVGEGSASSAADRLLTALASDAHASVRAAAADSAGRLARPALLGVLTKLSADVSTDVRLRAASALSSYPADATYDTLLTLTADDSARVQQGAHDSLRALAGPYPVERRLADAISNRRPDTRYHCFTLLAELGSKRYGKPLRARLSKEKRPRNIAALIRALVAADARDSGDDILRFADHEAGEVREAVALAVGRFELARGYQLVRQLSMNDPMRPVRCAAIEAMGRIGDAQFADDLQKVLEATGFKDNLIGSVERAVAAWSAGQIAQPSEGLLKRMVVQITRPVVPNPMGPPSHDSDTVRLTCAWALVEHAMKTPASSAPKKATAMLALLLQDPGDPELMRRNFPLSVPLHHYSYQAQQYQRGEAVTRLELTNTNIRFRLRRVKKRAP
jgi:HEAT repeat protein